MLWMAVMKRKKKKRKRKKKRSLIMGKLPMSVVKCVCYVGLWKALYVGSLLIVIHGVVDEVAVGGVVVVVKKMKMKMERESLEGKSWLLMVMKKLVVERRHGGFEPLERQWPFESSSGVST